ncbi:MAG: DNA polymerase III subunit gamma/tau C-terminal domain-containing protein, partial [Methylobacter sp.]
PDFSEVLQQILQVLHRIALVQQIPAAIDHDFDADMIAALSPLFTPEDIQLYYQIGLVGQRDLDLAPDPRSGFEMVMLRMLTFRPAAVEAVPVKQAQIRRTPHKTDPQPVYSHAKSVQPAIIAEKNSEEKIIPRPDDNWVDIIAAMKINGLTRELANNCVLENINDTVCTLILDPSHKHLRRTSTEENLRKALQAYRGTPLKLVINAKQTTIDTPAVQMTKEREDKQQAAIEAINSDENIQALKEHFDARVMPGTIEPV